MSSGPFPPVPPSPSPAAPAPAPVTPSSNQGKVIAAIVAVVVVLLLVGVRLGVRMLGSGASLPDEREIAQLLKEAAGTSPIQRDDPGRRAIRDGFRYLLQVNSEHEAQTNAQLATYEMQALMSPTSFLPEAAARTSERLHLLKQLDEDYVAKVRRFPEVMKQNVEKAGVSRLEVAAFSAGMGQGGMEDTIAAVESEIQWLDATIALYDYAAANGAHIAVNRQELVIENDSVRERFNSLWERAEQLRATAVAQADAADADSAQKRKELGLTERDLGER